VWISAAARAEAAALTQLGAAVAGVFPSGAAVTETVEITRTTDRAP
jgi:hypothetical protein